MKGNGLINALVFSFVLSWALMLIPYGCSNEKTEDPPLNEREQEYVNTLRHDDSLLIVDLYRRLDSMSAFTAYDAQLCDRMRIENDSLKTKLFVANYKVERVRYYLNITLRNPSQTKFLKGWIKRAIQ